MYTVGDMNMVLFVIAESRDRLLYYTFTTELYSEFLRVRNSKAHFFLVLSTVEQAAAGYLPGS